VAAVPAQLKQLSKLATSGARSARGVDVAEICGQYNNGVAAWGKKPSGVARSTGSISREIRLDQSLELVGEGTFPVSFAPIFAVALFFPRLFSALERNRSSPSTIGERSSALLLLWK